MAAQYKDKRLPHPELNSYKTEFERDLFMVINLLRENPLSFQTYIKAYVNKGKFSGDPNAANTLISKLTQCEQLTPITLNNHASNACYVNLTKNQDTPSNISGNAVKELKTVEPSLTSEYKVFDTYKRKWTGSPLELVIVLLLSYYERQGVN